MVCGSDRGQNKVCSCMNIQKYEMFTEGISLAFLLSGAGTAWEYHGIDIIRTVVSRCFLWLAWKNVL